MSWSRRIQLLLHSRTARRRSLRSRRVTAQFLEKRVLPAQIFVTSLEDNLTVDGKVTLREALLAASLDRSVDGSETGRGADVISFDPTLFAEDPQDLVLSRFDVEDSAYGRTHILISTEVTIEGPTRGHGLTIRSDSANQGRLFYINPHADVTMARLTLEGGVALGGRGADSELGGAGGGAAGFGGAVFVDGGDLQIRNSLLVGNRAEGGAGGSGGQPGNASGGGGGGGTRSPGEGPKGVTGALGGDGGGPGGGTLGSDGGERGGGSGAGGASSVTEDTLGHRGGNGKLFGGAGGGGSAFSSLGEARGGQGGDGAIAGGGAGGAVGYSSASTGVGGPGGVAQFGGGGGGADARTDSGSTQFGVGGNSEFGGRGVNGADGRSGDGGGGAAMGGALFAYRGNVSIVNSTFSQNQVVGGASPGNGGGGAGLGASVAAFNSVVDIRNATFARNLATGGTGADSGVGDADIFTYRIPGSSATNVTVAIHNTIVDGFLSGRGVFLHHELLHPYTSVEGTANLFRTHSGFQGTVLSTADPRLSPLADYGGLSATLLPLPGSPAIDAADGEFIIDQNTDQRAGHYTRHYDASLIRPQGPPDIGAAELQYLDFGDAFEGRGVSYPVTEATDGPRSLIDSRLYLGQDVDWETDGQASANAEGDDQDGGVDDEDGIVVIRSLELQQTPEVTVTATNLTEHPAEVRGWIDYNRNGVFDSGTEEAIVDIPAGVDQQQFVLRFPTVPKTAGGPRTLRLRIGSRGGVRPDGFGVGGETEDYSVIIPKDAPVITGPIGVVSEIRPTLTWTTDPDARQYDVWVKNQTTNKNPFYRATIASTQHVPTSDFGIGRYNVWVRAHRADGTKSDYSLQHNFTVRPAMSMNDPGRTLTDPRPTLEWPRLPGAVEYDLWIKDQTRGIDQFVREKNLTGIQWQAASDMPIGRYHAWVRGVAADGTTSQWSPTRRFDIKPPPKMTTGTNPTFSRSPQFEWHPVAGAVRYEIYVRNRINGSTTLYERNIETTSFVPEVPLADGPYRFWMIAVSENGLRGQWTEPFDIYIGGRTAFTSPSDQTADRTPVFTWRPVDGAGRYDLWVDHVGGEGQIIRQTELQQPEYRPETELPAGTFRAWVRAVSHEGEVGPWSLVSEFQITAHRKLDHGPVQETLSAGPFDSELPGSAAGGVYMIVSEHVPTESQATASKCRVAQEARPLSSTGGIWADSAACHEGDVEVEEGLDELFQSEVDFCVLPMQRLQAEDQRDAAAATPALFG